MSEGCPLGWGAPHSMSLEVGGQGSSPILGVPGDVECSEDRGQLYGHDWF